MQRLYRILALAALTLLLLIPSAQAGPSRSLCVDQQGNVYFSDFTGVWKIDLQGKLSLLVKDLHAHHLAVDAAGSLYGLEKEWQQASGTYRLSYFRIADNGVNTVPAKTAQHLFASTDDEGYHYLLHHTQGNDWIERMTPDGTTTTLAGSATGFRDGSGDEARFRSFGGAAWGPDNHLYVASGGYIRKISKDGTVTTFAGPEQGLARDPDYPILMDVKVDPRGNVYVTDPEQNKVFRITPDGKTTELMKSGRSWRPTGLALSGDNVYVLEWGLSGADGVRVRKIAADGRVSVVGRTG